MATPHSPAGKAWLVVDAIMASPSVRLLLIELASVFHRG